jgi:hypothetical protein
MLLQDVSRKSSSTINVASGLALGSLERRFGVSVRSKLSPVRFLLLIASLALPAMAGPLSVAPGGVVRWPGDEVERCGQAGRTWEAVAGDCWYPIDLLTPEGEVSLFRWRRGERERATVRVSSYPYEVQHITLKDDSQVNLSSADLERVQAESRRIGALWVLDTPRRFDLPLSPPLEPLPPGGRFGSRRYFNDQPRSPHTGADYSAAEGTPVLAIADGRVALAADFFFSGGSVFLDHGDGLISMYFHLEEWTVEEGGEVRRGEVIGKVGQTGRATGPHLHMGARWRGARIDPMLLLAPPEQIPTLP